uniref:Uncharacterized protein n=1 Tax=Hyaloperonospora arabidopsidis (strain Emoy2) TaxID=559515 RepID=M4BBS2_HYAAE
MIMKNTLLAVALSLVSVGTAFYAMVYPAWFQQHYRRDGKDVYQGYGLFAFYSTSSLESPFYASTTVLQYTDFCVTNYITPNYMLGDGADFHDILCGKRMMAAQATTATGAAVVYGTRRVFLHACGLSAYTSCKADNTKWHCWFYGCSFWVCLASVIILSITGYLSSAGRAEKIRYFRKEYERDLVVAMQQSVDPDVHHGTHQTQFVRTGSVNGFGVQATQQSYGQAPTPAQFSVNSGQPYTTPQNMPGGPSMVPHNNVYDTQNLDSKPVGYPQQQVGNVPLAVPSTNGLSRTVSNDSDAVYPSYSEQRRNHSLLGRQPSGGVV